MPNVQKDLYATQVVYQHYVNPFTLKVEYDVPAMPIALVSSVHDAELLCEQCNLSFGEPVRFYDKLDDYQKIVCKYEPLPFDC